jgi:hypothetical protein
MLAYGKTHGPIYYQRNREKLLERAKAWYGTNKEKKQEYDRTLQLARAEPRRMGTKYAGSKCTAASPYARERSNNS